MADAFRWIEWNIDHATQHGCTIAEIESVVRNRRRPWPRKEANGKWMVEGRGQGNRMVRVVYLIDEPDATYFVIHAMPLTTRRRRR
jgi:hypothetical protein